MCGVCPQSEKTSRGMSDSPLSQLAWAHLKGVGLFQLTDFATPKAVGYDACQDVECGDKDSYAEALADSTTLLRGKRLDLRPHGGSERERR